MVQLWGHFANRFILANVRCHKHRHVRVNLLKKLDGIDAPAFAEFHFFLKLLSLSSILSGGVSSAAIHNFCFSPPISTTTINTHSLLCFIAMLKVFVDLVPFFFRTSSASISTWWFIFNIEWLLMLIKIVRATKSYALIADWSFRHVDDCRFCTHFDWLHSNRFRFRLLTFMKVTNFPHHPSGHIAQLIIVYVTHAVENRQ